MYDIIFVFTAKSTPIKQMVKMGEKTIKKKNKNIKNSAMFVESMGLGYLVVKHFYVNSFANLLGKCLLVFMAFMRQLLTFFLLPNLPADDSVVPLRALKIYIFLFDFLFSILHIIQMPTYIYINE